VRDGPQEGDRVVERKTGAGGHRGGVGGPRSFDRLRSLRLSAPQLGAEAAPDLGVDRGVHDDEEKPRAVAARGTALVWSMCGLVNAGERACGERQSLTRTVTALGRAGGRRPRRAIASTHGRPSCEPVAAGFPPDKVRSGPPIRLVIPGSQVAPTVDHVVRPRLATMP
jgi:hypothetical protein